ncbi:MAG: radical SAM protein [Thermodesulfobacteriota bacterium]
MCLTIPARVVGLSADGVTIEGPDGARSAARTPLVPGLEPGDWVLHINGLVIRKISPADAREIIELLEGGPPVDTALLDPGFRAAVEAVHRGEFGRGEIIRLLASEGLEKEALFREADTVRRAYLKDFICIHGIIEFSNHCAMDCLYCGLRGAAPGVERYRMEPGEIVDTAVDAALDRGFKLLVLQSGDDPYYTDPMLVDIIRAIKESCRVFIFISAGERGRESYGALKEAGASGVLLRFETSNPTLFRTLHPRGKDLDARYDHLGFFKELGYYVATGSLVGLPGQGLEDIAEDILVTRDLADMVSTGPFIPTPGTPLAGSRAAAPDLYLKVSAVLRLMMKSARIPVVTAFETLAGGTGRRRALRSGANSLMVNLTPESYRGLYTIYPDRFLDTNGIFERYGLFKYQGSFEMLEDRMSEELA